MPPHNRFQHQSYIDSPPTSPPRVVVPASFPPVGSDEFRRRMRAAGRALESHGVEAIYLVHGTFVGTDAAGFVGALGRFSPGLSELLGGWLKNAINHLTDESGNFTDGYGRLLEASLNAPGPPAIAVRRFDWSSKNHHLGRAEAAVRLCCRLKRDCRPGSRALLWGHSHAGNVFALLTNLLAADAATRERFFEAAEPHYRDPVSRQVDLPEWTEADQWLREHQGVPAQQLDLVTLGTPIRYGWDTAGCDHLLHLVHHRPVPGMAIDRAPFPAAPGDLLLAARGDYVQQLGIAGTDLPPAPLPMSRGAAANEQLASLVEHDVKPAELLARLACGRIVSHDGPTLLVDYRQGSVPLAQELLGHGVYTHREWMLFHTEQVAAAFYAPI